MSVELKISFKQGEPRPKNLWDDHQWTHDNYDALKLEYGPGCLLVYQQSVIGQGKSIEDAVADATQRLASEDVDGVITPAVEFLSNGPDLFFIKMAMRQYFRGAAD